MNRFKVAMVRIAHSEMLPPNRPEKETKGRDIWPEACYIAEQRFNDTERVVWQDFSTEYDFGSGYSMGDSIAAEKDTGNFDDDVLSKTVTRTGTSTLDMIKVTQHAEHDEDTEYESEQESVGENV